MEERKANWTDANISLLVDLVTDGERWAIIRGKLPGSGLKVSDFSSWDAHRPLSQAPRDE